MNHYINWHLKLILIVSGTGFTFKSEVSLGSLGSTMTAAIRSASQKGQMKPAVSQKLGSLAASYDEVLAKCKSGKEKSDTACLESNNEGVNNFMNMMGQISTVAGTYSMADNCSKLADVLKVGQAAQAGFRAGCATAKGLCTDDCKKAVEIKSSVLSALTTASNQPETDSTLIEKAKYERLLKVQNELAVLKGHYHSCEQEHIDAIKKFTIDPDLPPDTRGILAAKKQTINSPDECNGQKRDLINEESELLGKGGQESQTFTDLSSAIEQIKNSEEDDPVKLLAKCNDPQPLQKAGQNLVALYSSMQNHQVCADDIKTAGLNLSCDLTGTCPTTTTPNYCDDAKNKSDPLCTTPTIADNTISGVNGSGLPGFSSSTSDPNGSYLTGLDTSGGTDGGDFGDLGMGNENGRQNPGVPGGNNGGGNGLGGGAGNGSGKPGGGRNTASLGPDNQFGAYPGYGGGGYGSSGSGNKDDKQAGNGDPNKDPNAITLANGEKINKMGGLDIFQKVRTTLYDQVRMGTLLQPNITLQPF